MTEAFGFLIFGGISLEEENLQFDHVRHKRSLDLENEKKKNKVAKKFPI